MTITSRSPRAMSLLSLLPMVAALALAAGCQTGGNTTSSSSSSSSTSSSSSSGDGGTTETTSYTIDNPVRTISMDARAGQLTVRAKDGAIAVTERARYTESKPVTSHEVSGDTLRLREQGCPERPSRGPCQVEWEITAPAGTVLDLQTHAGGVELVGMSAEVRAHVGSGGVRARDLTSKQVTASSDAGGVELGFAEPPDNVTATVDAGGVEISVPGGTSYAVRAQTGAGGKDINVPQDPASPHKITARADAGGIEITAR